MTDCSLDTRERMILEISIEILTRSTDSVFLTLKK